MRCVVLIESWSAVRGAENKSIAANTFALTCVMGLLCVCACVCNNLWEHVPVFTPSSLQHVCLRVRSSIIFASEQFSCPMYHPPPSVSMSGPITAPIAHRDD